MEGIPFIVTCRFFVVIFVSCDTNYIKFLAFAPMTGGYVSEMNDPISKKKSFDISRYISDADSD